LSRLRVEHTRDPHSVICETTQWRHLITDEFELPGPKPRPVNGRRLPQPRATDPDVTRLVPVECPQSQAWRHAIVGDHTTRVRDVLDALKTDVFSVTPAVPATDARERQPCDRTPCEVAQ
jgi:hypothetical protein